MSALARSPECLFSSLNDWVFFYIYIFFKYWLWVKNACVCVLFVILYLTYIFLHFVIFALRSASLANFMLYIYLSGSNSLVTSQAQSFIAILYFRGSHHRQHWSAIILEEISEIENQNRRPSSFISCTFVEEIYRIYLFKIFIYLFSRRRISLALVCNLSRRRKIRIQISNSYY